MVLKINFSLFFLVFCKLAAVLIMLGSSAASISVYLRDTTHRKMNSIRSIDLKFIGVTYKMMSFGRNTTLPYKLLFRDYGRFLLAKHRVIRPHRQ